MHTLTPFSVDGGSIHTNQGGLLHPHEHARAEPHTQALFSLQSESLVTVIIWSEIASWFPGATRWDFQTPTNFQGCVYLAMKILTVRKLAQSGRGRMMRLLALTF